jgi:hypothetical protein
MEQYRPVRSASVVHRHIADEEFLVPIAGDLADLRGLYALNPVAAFVWHRLDGKQDLDEIAGAICDTWAVDLPTARRDIDELVGSMGRLGLLGLAP